MRDNKEEFLRFKEHMTTNNNAMTNTNTCYIDDNTTAISAVKTEKVTKRTVIVEDKEPVFTINLTREQAELMFIFAGSVGGHNVSGNGYMNEKFYLSMQEDGTYGIKVSANLNDLRRKLTSPLYDALHTLLTK